MNILVLEKLLYKKFIPIECFEKWENAEGVAEFLSKRDINVIEVSCRKESADKAIANIKMKFPNMIVGAGSVISAVTASRALDSGADYVSSFGLNPAVVTFCKKRRVAIIPGVETATEIEMALSCGLDFLRFFPSEETGGIRKLKAFGLQYPNVKFAPMGGITSENLAEYLALKNVLCCSGSYAMTKGLH